MSPLALPDGRTIPGLGLGTWHMGERSRDQEAELEALRCGLDLGINLIDTAEMYADGGAERVVGRAIAGRRDSVFLVSKVYPHNASARGAIAACERSLNRLATYHIDLYLLHWRGSIPLHETVEAFERLVRDGKIGGWGVSNFDIQDLHEIDSQPAGPQCMLNQVYYSVSQRGVEHDLLPWMREHSMPLMAYCPLDEGALAGDALLTQIGQHHGASAAQVAIAWLLSRPGVVPIPKAGRREHVQELARANELNLTAKDLQEIDQRFPPPSGRAPLMMV
ncbi:MAG: aldo/keto reductase [Quisquiliibacterium sp.]